MLTNPCEKYSPYPPIALPDRRWPERQITTAPRWPNRWMAHVSNNFELVFWNAVLNKSEKYNLFLNNHHCTFEKDA